MPRQKKHRINPDKILLKIHQLTFGRQSEIDAELSENPNFDRSQRLHRDRRLASWMPYKLDLLAGKRLDQATRKAWQRAVAELEQTRLVEIRGVRGSDIRLSSKGRRRVRELAGR